MLAQRVRHRHVRLKTGPAHKLVRAIIRVGTLAEVRSLHVTAVFIWTMALVFRILAMQEPRNHVHSETAQAHKLARATTLDGTLAADLIRPAILVTRFIAALAFRQLEHVPIQKVVVTKLFRAALMALVSTQRARVETICKVAIA